MWFFKKERNKKLKDYYDQEYDQACLGERSIEIECPPGSIRPGDLFPDVLRDTGLTPDDFINTERFFGHWIWVVRRDKQALFDKHNSVFKERITVLYNQGAIRAGSW